MFVFERRNAREGNAVLKQIIENYLKPSGKIDDDCVRALCYSNYAPFVRYMTAVFLTLIEQLNSSVIILILLLVLAFWLVHRFTRFATSFDNFKEERKELGKKDYVESYAISKWFSDSYFEEKYLVYVQGR